MHQFSKRTKRYSRKQWLRSNRGDDGRLMAQSDLGKPQGHGIVVHNRGTYEVPGTRGSTRAQWRNAMFGRKPKGNGKIKRAS